MDAALQTHDAFWAIVGAVGVGLTVYGVQTGIAQINRWITRQLNRSKAERLARTIRIYF